MANLQRLLGSMMATGVGGRSRRGPAFASSGAGLSGASALAGGRGGMSFSKTAGLASLGYLAYKAYQEYQSKGEGQGGRAERTGRAERQSGAPGGEPSLGERLAGMLGGGSEPEEQAQTELDDPKALLLIRAMVAAANADGEISPEERQRILAKLDEAEAGPEERQILERELARPRSVDELAREVHDEETAEQVYVASRIAMNPDTPAERAYLQYLASRLDLPPDRTQALDGAV